MVFSHIDHKAHYYKASFLAVLAYSRITTKVVEQAPPDQHIGLSQKGATQGCLERIDHVHKNHLIGKRQATHYNWIIMKAILTLCLLCGLFTCPARTEADTSSHQLLDLHNQARANGVRCGLFRKTVAGRLRWNEKLANAALSHARNMARKNRLKHRIKGSTRKRLKRAKYPWAAFGENLAMGFTSPEAALEGWLKSKRHCKNLMNPVFTEMGAAEHDTYWVVIFGATQVGATQVGKPQP